MIQDFFSKYNNKFLDYDNAYGNQCVDLVKAYFKEVLNLNPIQGDAIQYWWKVPQGFTAIKNTPLNYPQQGDLIVWNYPPNGHIAICQSANLLSLVCFEQNNPIGSPCHSAKHNYKSVLGWLRPNPIFPKVPLQIACIGSKMPDIASWQAEVSKYSSGKISFNVVQYTKDIKGKIDQANAYNIIDVMNPKEKFVFIFFQGPANSNMYASSYYPSANCYITTCPFAEPRALAFEFAHQLQKFYDDNRGSLPFVEITDSNFPSDDFIKAKYDSVSKYYQN